MAGSVRQAVPSKWRLPTKRCEQWHTNEALLGREGHCFRRWGEYGLRGHRVKAAWTGGWWRSATVIWRAEVHNVAAFVARPANHRRTDTVRTFPGAAAVRITR
jgi:hypothetical protein